MQRRNFTTAGVPLQQIADAVSGRIIQDGEIDEVRWIVASGLMSDVLTTEEDDILLLSNLTTPQVVRTADMVGASAILITSGKEIPGATRELARRLGIALLAADLPVFETCCALTPLFYEVE